MGTQTNFSGGGRSVGWELFFEGLRSGHVSAYLLLIALLVAAAVALWAGSNMMRKETPR
jgi:hypothetical protein